MGRFMGKEPTLLRMEALRCGGRGGGEGFAAVVPGVCGMKEVDEELVALPVLLALAAGIVAGCGDDNDAP